MQNTFNPAETAKVLHEVTEAEAAFEKEERDRAKLQEARENAREHREMNRGDLCNPNRVEE